MSTPKPWADTPFPLLPIPGAPGAASTSNADLLFIAVEMANVHNALIRGLNTIVLQAPHVTLPTDIADLMMYIKAWCDTVHHHHAGEEKILFPRLDVLAKEAGIQGTMDTNVEQHHMFESKLLETNAYVQDVRDGKKEYSSAELIRLIDGFAPVLTQHLHDEIDSLLKLERCDGAKIKKAMADTAASGLKSLDPNVSLPFILGCVDRTYLGSENFPPIPFFIPWLNAYWFSRKYQGSWRFNPCDHWGKPQPLKFLE